MTTMIAAATPVATPVALAEGEDGPPHIKGCVLLYEAFWAEVHENLANPYDPQCRHVVAWIEGRDATGGRSFATWCGLAGAKPEAVRAALWRRHPAAFVRFGLG